MHSCECWPLLVYMSHESIVKWITFEFAWRQDLLWRSLLVYRGRMNMDHCVVHHVPDGRGMWASDVDPCPWWVLWSNNFNHRLCPCKSSPRFCSWRLDLILVLILVPVDPVLEKSLMLLSAWNVTAMFDLCLICVWILNQEWWNSVFGIQNLLCMAAGPHALLLWVQFSLDVMLYKSL